VLTLHADGSFSFAPAPNFNGDVAFSYQVVDPHGAHSDPQGFVLTVDSVNDAPEFTGSAVGVTSLSGAEVAIATGVSASDIDSDSYAGGTLTATVTNGGTKAIRCRSRLPSISRSTAPT